ncbi:MAG: ABC transporter ATP-binding protein [bacterium]|nr:ABC transporter ATP-binding protein [bacterium]
MKSNIALRDISFSLGTFSLQAFSLEIKEGEYFILAGQSGAGKTVLLDLIAGLKKPATGNVLINGQCVEHVEPAGRHIGYVFQEQSLFTHLTVGANIAFGLLCRKWDSKKRIEKVNEMAELLAITHLLERTVTGLSGGEAQRVALARALAPDPRLLLLDEPLACLDPPARDELRKTLMFLHEKLETTTIHVTHSTDEAFKMGDRMAIMAAGHLLQTGVPEDLYMSPASRYVAEFLGDVNTFAGKVVGFSDGRSRVQFPFGICTVPGRLEGLVTGLIRPEQVRLATSCREGDFVVTGIVKRILSEAGTTHVWLETNGLLIKVASMVGEVYRLNLVTGSPATVGWAPESLRVLPEVDD